MAINKVDANGRTLIDLTSDTVTADTLVSGRTAHLASGAQVTGTFEPVTGVKGNAESTYRKGNVNLTPANLGLGNVDNTSDANKPISTAAQAKFDKQQAQIDYNTNQGVKNQLIVDKSRTATVSGITVTSNGDGTFTLNGSNSTSSAAMIVANVANLSLTYSNQATSRTIKSNRIKFYMVGAPSTLQLQLEKNTTMSIDGATAHVIRGSAISEVVDITNYTYVWLRLAANANASFNNVIIKPMVVDASVTDTSNFEPYAMSNAELTQKALLKEDDNAGGYDITLDKPFRLGYGFYSISITRNGITLDQGGDIVSIKSDGIYFNGEKIGS